LAEQGLVRLVKFEGWHLEYLREHGVEMAVFDPRFLTSADVALICQRGVAFTILYKDEPIACSGIVPLNTGVGFAWAVVNYLAARTKTRVVFVHARDGLRASSRPYHRIETVSPVCDKVAHSWIRHLGFRVESRMRMYGSDKTDYFKWVYFPEEN
jgi:hypothetical protein